MGISSPHALRKSFSGAANVLFGRRFALISFRWLSPGVV
jgi:hypothetical protein